MKAADINVGMEVAYTTYGNADARYTGTLRRGIVLTPASHGYVTIQPVDRETGIAAEGAPSTRIRTRGVGAPWAEYVVAEEARKALAERKRADEKAYEAWFEKNSAAVIAALAQHVGIEVEDYDVNRARWGSGLTIRLDREQTEELIAVLNAQAGIADTEKKEN